MSTWPRPPRFPLDDLALALRLADDADAIAMDRFLAADLHVSLKPDRTHVTDADRAVERALRSTIEAQRPGDAIFGEEYGSAGSGARQWFLDPIDGTSNFLRGVPVWGSLIALAVDGTVVAGVASMPALGRRWWAAAGAGAFTSERGGEPRGIRVSGVASLADASLSFQSVAQWEEAGRLDTLLGLTRDVWRDRAYGDLWSYALLAEGLVDAVAEFGVHPYDVAALIPIVEEAGGRFTSSGGGPALTSPAPLATNGLLHDELLARFA